LTAQFAGHHLGDINAALYRLKGRSNNGIVDVTIGNISFAGVTGPAAATGYDLASGWGTVNAASFVPRLAAKVGSLQ
jgi:hypothetical protein